MTQLPEPNFIDRNPETITNEWIKLYEEKSGKTLQSAQIERLMVDVGAYRETVLRMAIQETAKQNLLSYASLNNLEHIGEPLDVRKLLASSSVTTLQFSVDSPLDFNFTIQSGVEVETKDGLFVFQSKNPISVALDGFPVNGLITLKFKVCPSATNTCPTSSILVSLTIYGSTLSFNAFIPSRARVHLSRFESLNQ